MIKRLLISFIIVFSARVPKMSSSLLDDGVSSGQIKMTLNMDKRNWNYLRKKIEMKL